MSFKFDHNNKKFWAKEAKGHTEVYYLEKKGLAEKLVDLPGRFASPEELLSKLYTLTGRVLEVLK